MKSELGKSINGDTSMWAAAIETETGGDGDKSLVLLYHDENKNRIIMWWQRYQCRPGIENQGLGGRLKASNCG